MPRSGIPKGKQKRWKSIPFHRRRTWQFASRYNPRFRPRVRLKPWEVPPSGAAVKREVRIVRTREQRIQEEREKEEAKLLEPKPAEETVQAKPQPKQTEQTRPRIITQEQKTIRFYHGEFQYKPSQLDRYARPTPLIQGGSSQLELYDSTPRIRRPSPSKPKTERRSTPPTSIQVARGIYENVVEETVPRQKTVTSEEWVNQAEDKRVRDVRRAHVETVAELKRREEAVESRKNYLMWKKRQYASALLGVRNKGDKRGLQFERGMKIAAGFPFVPSVVKTASSLLSAPKPKRTLKQQQEELQIAEDTLREIEKQARKKSEGEPILGYMAVKSGGGEYKLIPKTFFSPESAIRESRKIREEVIAPRKEELTRLRKEIIEWAEEEPRFIIERPPEKIKYTDKEAIEYAKSGQDLIGRLQTDFFSFLESVTPFSQPGTYEVKEGRYVRIGKSAKEEIIISQPHYKVYEGIGKELEKPEVFKPTKIEITSAEYKKLSERMRRESYAEVKEFEERLKKAKEREYIQQLLIGTTIGGIVGGAGGAIALGGASIPSTFVSQKVTERTGSELLGFAASLPVYVATGYGISKYLSRLGTTTRVTAPKSVHGIEYGEKGTGVAKTEGIAEVKGIFGTKKFRFKQPGIYYYESYGRGQRIKLLTKSIVKIRRGGVGGWISRTRIGRKIGMKQISEKPMLTIEELRPSVQRGITYRFLPGRENILEAIPREQYTVWTKSRGAVLTPKSGRLFTSASRTSLTRYPPKFGLGRNIPRYFPSTGRGSSLRGLGRTLAYRGRVFSETLIGRDKITDWGSRILYKIRKISISKARKPFGRRYPKPPRLLDLRKLSKFRKVEVEHGYKPPSKAVQEAMLKPQLRATMRGQLQYGLEQAYYSQMLPRIVGGGVAYAGLSSLQIQEQRKRLLQMPQFKLEQRELPTIPLMPTMQPLVKPTLSLRIPKIEISPLPLYRHLQVSPALKHKQISTYSISTISPPRIEEVIPSVSLGAPPEIPVPGIPTLPFIGWPPGGFGGGKKKGKWWERHGLRIHPFLKLRL